MDRRRFLQAAAVAGLATSGAGSHGAEHAGGAAKRVGLIGCGWYGKSALFRLLQVAPVEVVALCDVDKTMLAEAAAMVAERQASRKAPRTYGDYREMLKQEPLDIVQVSAPDHWHALAMIAAVQAGADVYCEKPISVDVVEGRAMVAAAKKHGRVVQVNMQRRSTPHVVQARNEIIREGKLGKIGLVEAYCYYQMRARQNPPDEEPPANFDYEMWAGPAPKMPYNRLIHPRSWRAFMEYGNGILGDMCVHMLDMVRFTMDLGWPKHISSTGGIYVDPASRANITDTQTATFDYGDTQVVWQHRAWGDSPYDPKIHPWGATYYGENGTLILNVHGYDFLPRDKGQKPVRVDVLYEYEKYPEDRTEKDLERHVAAAMRRHWLNLLECIATRGKPVSNIEEGYISAASCILANLSLKLGRSMAFDPEKGQVIGDPEANGLLARPYRAPWVHPDPAKV